VIINAKESRIDEGRGARVQLPARSTATQQTSSSKSCRQEKRQTSSTKPEKVIRPEGCEAIKVEISDAIQTKDARLR
jgi:hypothetical protein